MDERSPSAPVRSCIGCGKPRKKEQLIRLCAGEERKLEIDIEGKRPGRGAYLCPLQSCIRQAFKRNAFYRSLRGITVDYGAEELEERILAGLRRELNRLLPNGADVGPDTRDIHRFDSVLPKKKKRRCAELWYKYQSMNDVIR